MRFTPVGAYLGDGSEDEEGILLPQKYVEEGWQVGDTVSVFLYRDSEDRLITTTLQPKLELNQFGYLRVNQVNFFGAFLDWGIEKDLMVPFSEQKKKLEEGQWPLVYLYLDEKTNRLLATAKTGKYIKEAPADLGLNKSYPALVGDQFEVGIRMLVDNQYLGMLYHSDLTRELRRGDRIEVYPYNVREDGKIDVRLEPAGYEKISSFAQDILDAIAKHNGLLPLNDYSHPDDVRDILGMSKKNFKKAVGSLYKARKISISEEGIRVS